VWSAGCILAELLGGRPLFPGASTLNQLERVLSVTGRPTVAEGEECGGGPHAARVLATLAARAAGRGGERDRSDGGAGSAGADGAEAGASSSSLHPPDPHDTSSEATARRLAVLLPDAEPDGLDLLARLLSFSPRRRPSAAAALAHPYLARFHDPAQEPSAPRRVRPEDIDPPAMDRRVVSAQGGVSGPGGGGEEGREGQGGQGAAERYRALLYEDMVRRRRAETRTGGMDGELGGGGGAGTPGGGSATRGGSRRGGVRGESGHEGGGWDGAGTRRPSRTGSFATTQGSGRGGTPGRTAAPGGGSGAGHAAARGLVAGSAATQQHRLGTPDGLSGGAEAKGGVDADLPDGGRRRTTGGQRGAHGSLHGDSLGATHPQVVHGVARRESDSRAAGHSLAGAPPTGLPPRSPEALRPSHGMGGGGGTHRSARGFSSAHEGDSTHGTGTVDTLSRRVSGQHSFNRGTAQMSSRAGLPVRVASHPVRAGSSHGGAPSSGADGAEGGRNEPGLWAAGGSPEPAATEEREGGHGGGRGLRGRLGRWATSGAEGASRREEEGAHLPPEQEDKEIKRRGSRRWLSGLLGRGG